MKSLLSEGLKVLAKVGLVFFWMIHSASAAAKRLPSLTGALDGKRVIQINKIPRVDIEMPDRSLHAFGEDYESRLMTRLTQSGRFLVSTAEGAGFTSTQPMPGLQRYIWQGSVTPAAILDVEVRSLGFYSGSKGDRMFYGFDEHFKTPFNIGDPPVKNEFPLKDGQEEPSWFGGSFSDQAIDPFNRRSGLDLGGGLSINALYAWLTLKYSEYHSELRLRLHMTFPPEFSSDGAGDPRMGHSEYHDLSVRGSGFYFDAVGAYSGYSAGIMIARSDALLQAVSHAIDSSFDTVERVLSSVPLIARVDGVMPGGVVLLGTGPYSQVRPGVLFSVVDQPRVILEVIASGAGGSESKVILGDLALISQGAMVRQIESVPSSSPTPSSALRADSKLATFSSDGGVPASMNSVLIPAQTIDKPSLPPVVSFGNWKPITSEAQAVLKSLTDMIFLPYRIYRYFTYDQKYHREADLSLAEWPKNSDSWKKQIELDSAPPMKSGNPVVAIIDSGMDYNHPLLHSSLWLNPTPWHLDETESDRYGWDFISNDSHPFDDHAHGTQLASLVVSVAPNAKIMPLKVFNPWGITSSSSIYAAFQYAVNHGAQVILCGWSTSVDSKALKGGLELAKSAGIPVVASAGDGGWNLSHVWAYPASYSAEMDHLLVVAGVDRQDRIVSQGQLSSNYGKNDVTIAAPGLNLPVAEPRGVRTLATSADLAAALVAGALARVVAVQEGEAMLSRSAAFQIQTLMKDADFIPTLENQIHGGLRLRIRR